MYKGGGRGWGYHVAEVAVEVVVRDGSGVLGACGCWGNIWCNGRSRNWRSCRSWKNSRNRSSNRSRNRSIGGGKTEDARVVRAEPVAETLFAGRVDDGCCRFGVCGGPVVECRGLRGEETAAGGAVVD